MNMPNNMPKSILKKSAYKPGRKRLFSKLNTLMHTNGFDELIEEQIMKFIPRPYQLVPWRGVDARKLDISDNIMIDIGAETTNLAAVCEFLVVKNGAAKENCEIAPKLIVRDAGLQVNTNKNTKSIDFYSLQRREHSKPSVDKNRNKNDQCMQTEQEEKKMKLTAKPTEDKCVATDDILESLPELKDFSIKDLMSTSCQDFPRPESCFENDLKKDTRYRDSADGQVKKLVEKCPLTETKRLVHITNFFDYAAADKNYEEYEVNDFLCDTEDLTRYFNFDSYTFGDLLSGKIRVHVKDTSSSFKLIDIKIKGPGSSNTSEVGTLTDDSLVKKTSSMNKITQTDRKIEEKKYSPKYEIKCQPAAIKPNRKTSGFDDIINSMNKKIQAVNQIASNNQFENFKNNRRQSQISESSQYNYSDVWSQNSAHNEKLENHIEKYYNTSTLKYPLISKAIGKKAKRSSLSNSCRSESYCSLRHDPPAVDYLSDYKSCPICNRRRRTSDKTGQKYTTPFSSFDNLVKKSTDLAGNKNYAHEYLVDNSFIVDCESELFDTSRYLRANHDKMLSMYADEANSSILNN